MKWEEKTFLIWSFWSKTRNEIWIWMIFELNVKMHKWILYLKKKKFLNFFDHFLLCLCTKTMIKTAKKVYIKFSAQRAKPELLQILKKNSWMHYTDWKTKILKEPSIPRVRKHIHWIRMCCLVTGRRSFLVNRNILYD